MATFDMSNQHVGNQFNMDIQQKKAAIVEYLQERLRIYRRRVDACFEELRATPTPARQGTLLDTINRYRPIISEFERLLQDDLGAIEED